jgi:hypothetical protein
MESQTAPMNLLRFANVFLAHPVLEALGHFHSAISLKVVFENRRKHPWHG